jgi:SAM-dependent methyltransferase
VSDVHSAAAAGYAQGAETYARGRPGFPLEALGWLTNDLQLAPGKTVVELGAGTGKFTQLLLRTKADVIAVEPVAAMLARLSADLPAVRTLRATAQDLPLAGASVDAVICAQSFHWFATPGSLAEIRRVLKPGGVLGLIWNVRDQSIDWIAELTRIMAPYEGDAPRYDKGEWRRVFPAPGFGPLQEKSFAHAHVGSADRVIMDRVASVSFIAALDDATRRTVLDEVRTLIAATPALAGKAQVSAPYLTRAYWTLAR